MGLCQLRRAGVAGMQSQGRDATNQSREAGTTLERRAAYLGRFCAPQSQVGYAPHGLSFTVALRKAMPSLVQKAFAFGYRRKVAAGFPLAQRRFGS